MSTSSRLFCLFMLVFIASVQAVAQQPTVASVTKADTPPGTNDSPNSTTPSNPSADPLVRLLVSKGLLTPAEVVAVNGAATPEAQREVLARVLLNKGVISEAEFNGLRGAVAVPAAVRAPEVQAPAATPRKPDAPKVIPAIAPIRALQTDPAKREGLIPDIKIGDKIRIKPYGFFKTSVVYDSSQPQGTDFPLPGFLGDSGPSGSPNFHLKARSFRFGANFEWIDLSPKMTLTGKFELDFEGNFARASNRNIGTVRSNAPTIRLAWVRIDRQLSEKVSGFLLFGQDWTPFSSSTLPNLIETTGLGIGFGTLYDRTPQVKGGFNFNVGGSRGLKFIPEFALTLPAFGNLPTDVGNQLGYGERQGSDSARPEFQGRFVTQFQLDKAPGVAPAQLIVSFLQSERKATVRAADVPTAFRAAFPGGAEVSSSRYGYTLEAQLPTRYVTILAKYWNGQDLRRFFSGQLYSEFNDTSGLTGTATGPSIDGASTVVFGLRDGVPTVAPQRPVRQQGGFFNLGFPLSRIFKANPDGRNAGWSMYLHYGYDQALARDARRFNAPRGRGDMFAANIQYKLNSFVTFAVEQTYYRTRSANSTATSLGGLPVFRGVPARATHNNRFEFATIFTF